MIQGMVLSLFERKICMDNHYDVGLVGYWYASNYGSVITYYALSEAVKKLGFSTVLIDRPEKERDPEGEDVFSRNFLREHCAISESVKKNELEKLSDLCDSFIIGSDQVWTKDAIKYFGYMFFLNFVADNKRKIAYAPSFGTAQFTVSPDDEEKVRYYLHRFDHVSIREDSGKKLLKNKFDIEAYQALDPVFLLTQEEYHRIADESQAPIGKDEKYILAYILDPDDDKEIALQNIAKALGLNVKIILDGRKGTFERNKAKFKIFDKEILPDIDAADWVKYFQNADYVFTDSHHGLAMSIIFNKELICYANYKRGYTRFVSLLSRVGMLERLVQNSKEISDKLLQSKIDYTAVQQKLNTGIEESMLWLKNALTSPVAQRSHEYYLLKYEIGEIKRSIKDISSNCELVKSDVLTLAKSVDEEIDRIYDNISSSKNDRS